MGEKLIAIVDDDHSIVELLHGLLTDEGYATCCCYSGAEGLDCIKQHGPILAIIDMQMEHKAAGLELIELMRSDEATKHIPVILYSADTLMLRQQMKRMTIDNCIVLEKPFDLFSLLAHIEQATNTGNQEKVA